MCFSCYDNSALGLVWLSQRVLPAESSLSTYTDENYHEGNPGQETFLVLMEKHTQGALIVVYSNKNSRQNTIMEIVVDSAGSVNTERILHNASITSNSVCAGISSEVKVKCNPVLDDDLMFEFAYDDNFPVMFEKIIIVPGQHPSSEMLERLFHTP